MARLEEDRDPDDVAGAPRGRGDAATAVPLRRCFATGRTRPQAEMVRFVLGPENEVVADVDARLPGRGFWLSATRDVVETAVVKKLFAKAARRQVTTPPDLALRIDRLLVRRFLDLLGLARRSGLVMAGFEKVATELKAGRAALLIEASDGAPGGREKMTRLDSAVPVAALATAAELGRAVGRDQAVHIAVRSGRLADVLLTEAERLARYRGMPWPGSEPPRGESSTSKSPPGDKLGVVEERQS